MKTAYNYIKHNKQRKIELITLVQTISIYYENRNEIIALIENDKDEITSIESCANNFEAFSQMVNKIIPNFQESTLLYT